MFIACHKEIRDVEIKRCGWSLLGLDLQISDSFKWYSFEINGRHYDLHTKSLNSDHYYESIHIKVDYVNRIVYEQRTMKLLAKMEGLHKLELNAGDIYWGDIFEPVTARNGFENYLLQLVKESTDLNEIELGFLDHRHVYRFSRDAYDRFLLLARARNRKLTITFNFPSKCRLPWPITRKFGINAEYLRQNEKHLEILLKFERCTRLRERCRRH